MSNLALLLTLLALTACGAQAVFPPLPAVGRLLPTSALTQAQIDANALQAQATATADVLQAQQRATGNAADSTQSVALTQAQLDANALRAQETATADVLQAQQRQPPTPRTRRRAQEPRRRSSKKTNGLPAPRSPSPVRLPLALNPLSPPRSSAPTRYFRTRQSSSAPSLFCGRGVRYFLLLP